ncbi:winged helix-turn-helix domain-containing protein [Paeniglutamicibacter sp. NPDC091659]|uniref:winged helix-turn-helix domain-containing protein n=1 Tax=Paeniglutamicibacter sp. NPDC091659 TaxID=3364389 RepID=UPI0037F3E624
MTTILSTSQARRIALAAQGLHRARPTAPVTIGAVGRTFNRLELLQIDSVNVLTRAQYLPLFSRLGPYETSLLDDLCVGKPRKILEYWAHEASLVRSEHFADLVPWQRRTWPGSLGALDDAGHSLSREIQDLLQSSPPLTAREVSEELGHVHPKETVEWGWNWSAVKRVLEALFAEGIITASGRNNQFERRYTALEKVLPEYREQPEPVDPRLAMERLLLASAKAHGVGTAHCLADYFRLPVRESAAVLEDLNERSMLVRAGVHGQKDTFYMLPDTVIPRRASARALLSPFDSLVFNRKRIEKIFNFNYRLEIYTPSEKRTYGYYVLPFLLGENLVGRVDVKADRSQKSLLVRGAYAEPDAPPETADELAKELHLLAEWLGLEDIDVSPRGNLAAALEFSLSSPKFADNHK